jgi:hypothetical protein
MFFGILWITAFFDYTCKFVIMVSASTYYWNSNAHEEGEAEVGTALHFAFCHSGSLAFASFIIAVVRFIKIVFIYMAKQAEKQSGENPAVKAAVRCAICVLECLERITDYINESACAYMAVSGENFCTSAW